MKERRLKGPLGAFGVGGTYEKRHRRRGVVGLTISQELSPQTSSSVRGGHGGGGREVALR